MGLPLFDLVRAAGGLGPADEPVERTYSNDLDIPALEVLEDSLADFPGAVV